MRFLPVVAASLLTLAAAVRAAPPEPGQQLAFVLLDKPALPTATSVIAALRALAPAEKVKLVPGRVDGKSLSFTVGDAGLLVASLVPAPVPKGEADANFSRSLSGVLGKKKLAAHHAHVAVVFRDEAGRSRKDGLVRFTQLVAALSEASKAVGVYWGGAAITHTAEFFQEVARESDADLMLMLWVGFDIAGEGANRVSILTNGLPEQFGIMDLRVTMPKARMGEGLGWMLDLVNYAVKRGSAVPDGETVGVTEQEKLEVKYEPSPIDPRKKIWRVDRP